MSDDKDEKVLDPLEQIRKVEKRRKAQLLTKVVFDLKYSAREIMKLKEKSTMLLNACGVDGKDVKRIVDFLNELPEVKLSGADLKQLEEEVKRTLDSKSREVRKEIEEHPMQNSYFANSGSVSAGLGWGTAATAVGNGLTLTSGTNTVNLAV